MSKRLLMALACSVLLMGLAACGSNDKASTSEEPRQETKKEEEQKKIEEQKKVEEQKQAEEQKRLEQQKKAEEQKKLEEQRKQEEAQRQQGEQKTIANTATQQQAAPKQEKVHFANCTDANNAGYYDITPDSPAYASHLDRDGDGVACERNKGHKKSSKKH
ncbi:excalibur calcium-binding domain-containing protein [Bacillus toyonensis]|uniref:excalibur calcium-binding domain-containing protein n=1 Tax=Bacillus toyonensis TaxID=155322 RepID=UPI00346555B3